MLDSLSFIGAVIVGLHPSPCVSDVVVLDQNCSFEANWLSLIQFVQDDALKYKTVAGGGIVYSDTPILITEEIFHSSGFLDFPPPLTQYVIQIERSPELVELSSIPDRRILDELIKLLDKPNRAWAAHILIGKLLGHDSVDQDNGMHEWGHSIPAHLPNPNPVRTLSERGLQYVLPLSHDQRARAVVRWSAVARQGVDSLELA
jgi:hypothetical protein